MARIVIDEARCKGCGLCTSACTLCLITMSSETNHLGYAVAMFAAPEKCTGCTFCAQVCPDVAITVFR
jgi:2-oxoglutarate ferredoxin oxidoreductase subunit delta